MQFPVFHAAQSAPQVYRQPQPAVLPDLPSVEFFALYREARTGGDFYDFAIAGDNVLLLLCDISGKREQALPMAAEIQEIFRQRAPELFGATQLNPADRLTELTLALNRGILQAAGGVHHCPAFLACYHHPTGTLTYINAGHTPALVRDEREVLLLEASGIPLGLFSHAIHDAQFCALRPGAALLLVSRGIVETRKRSREFGVNRLRHSLLHASFENARQLCAVIQSATQKFAPGSRPENDMTAVALVRARAQAHSFGG